MSVLGQGSIYLALKLHSKPRTEDIRGFCKTNETFDSVEKMKQTQQSLVVLDLTVVMQKKEKVPSKINVKSALQCVHASKRQFIVCLL